MSYEGYTQILCSNGHLSTANCWEEIKLNNNRDRCECGAMFVFRHEVDQTNDDGESYPFEVVTYAETKQCNLGHIHKTKEATYKIPQK